MSQFLASAAGERVAVVLTMDYLRREAGAGRREDFERDWAAVPGRTPLTGGVSRWAATLKPPGGLLLANR